MMHVGVLRGVGALAYKKGARPERGGSIKALKSCVLRWLTTRAARGVLLVCSAFCVRRSAVSPATGLWSVVQGGRFFLAAKKKVCN